jgi:hypothetical protein
MTTTDVLPTVAKLTGQPIPTDRIIDGKDVSDILLGKDGAKSPHETLYYENDGIRQGKWKLVHYRIKADWFTELYDLEADLGERTNIADQHPDRVKAMKAALDAHVAEIKQNSRSAGSVENPKPLLADASGLPTLAEYVSGTRRSTGIIDLTLTFAPKGDMTLNVRGLTIHCDEAKQEFQFTNTTRVEGEKAAMLRLPKERQRPYRDNGLRTIPAPMVDGKVTLRVLVDRASLELFVNDGQAAASFVVVPKADDRRISIDGNDEMKINSLIVNELKSVWPEDLLSEPLAVRTERNFPCDSKTKAKRQS